MKIKEPEEENLSLTPFNWQNYEKHMGSGLVKQVLFRLLNSFGEFNFQWFIMRPIVMLQFKVMSKLSKKLYLIIYTRHFIIHQLFLVLIFLLNLKNVGRKGGNSKNLEIVFLLKKYKVVNTNLLSHLVCDWIKM